MTGLSDLEHQVLLFEGQWWARAGAKDSAVREQFGCTSTEHYRRLNQLLDDPRALAAHPVTVARLRRLPDQRAAVRGRRCLAS